MVTNNPETQLRLLPLWLESAEKSEDPSLRRYMLLGNPRIKEVSAILLISMVARNTQACQQLFTHPTGTDILRTLLDYSADHYTNDENLVFDITFSLIKEIATSGIALEVYYQLADLRLSDLPPALPLSTHNVTFLKLVDAAVYRETVGQEGANLSGDTASNSQPPSTPSATVAASTLLTSLTTFTVHEVTLWARVLLTPAESPTDGNDTLDGPLVPPTLATLGRQLLAALETPGSIDSAAPPSLPTVSDDSSPTASAHPAAQRPISLDWMVSFYTGLVLLLQALKHITQYCRDTGLAEDDQQRALLKRTTEMLALLDAKLPRISKIDQSPGQIMDVDHAAKQFAFIKRDLIAIIGNLCHENTSLQNYARELGAVDLVLNHCNIDENNPYIKEYAILALKYLLQGNPANQDLIRSLQPQQTVPHADLESLGISTKLDSNQRVTCQVPKP
ncbi:Ataxin-10 [Dimargaris cristalligena]|nr:Ataxin-10 [Dimargaris cristalligena]